VFIERLLNQGNAPLLERMLDFTQARHRLIGENIVNISTPGYRQKDLSLDRFQEMLQERVAMRHASPPGAVGFDDIRAELEHPRRGVLFHDGANRSMEELMTAQAKNALMHNLAVELLKKQFESLEMALRERIA
jgi:flagellar basal-body rod protein FlgB